MLPALMALKPAIKYGVPVAILVALIGGTNTCSYVKGKRVVQQAWDASIAQQAAQSVREVVKAQAMESEVVRESDVRERDIKRKVDTIRKKVLRDPHKTITLSPATVRLHDELRSLSNKTDDRVPAADPGTGSPEILRGGLGSATTEVLQVEDGEFVELTMEELKQAATDYFEKYALLRNNYRGLSEWNDGREALEKARHGIEEHHE
jgi:hypothetical protein